MGMSRKKQQLSITIDPEVELVVRNGARDQRISVSAYIDKALRASPEVKRDLQAMGEQLELIPPGRGHLGRPKIPKA